MADGPETVPGTAEHGAAAPRRRAARRADPAAAPAAMSPDPPSPAPPRGPPGRSRSGSGCYVARPSVPGARPPRATRWFPARCFVGGPRAGGDGSRRPGGTLLLSSRCWPVDGWVRGTVAARSRASGFSYLVRYGRRRHIIESAHGSAAVPPLLDAASPGPAGRWVLLRRVAHKSVGLPFSGTTRYGTSGPATGRMPGKLERATASAPLAREF
jgi:hypothetical protein